MDVEDSNNINAAPIIATNSVDSGNNINWSIAAPSYAGYPASDVLGQPNFTTSDKYNGSSTPNAIGFTYGPAVYVDEINHRLYASDCGNRVLVFDLDATNNLIDKTADYVLGQPTFTADDYPTATTASSMNCPTGLVFDSGANRLFVPTYDARVMVFDLASGITNGMNASYVIGQSDFTTETPVASQAGLGNFYGQALAYDLADKRLFVMDSSHNRIMVYDLSGGITNGMNASYVLGQANFTDTTAGTSQSQLGDPSAIYYDETSRYLYVAEYDNNRVIVYDLSGGIANGMNASYVLGQPNFTSAMTQPISASTVQQPVALAFDAQNKMLFVGTGIPDRVTVFDVNTISNHEDAVMVIGQSNFTANVFDCDATTQTTFCNVSHTMYFDSSNRRLYTNDVDNFRSLIFDFVDLEPAALAQGQASQPYNAYISSAKSQGTVAYTLAGGVLPAGLVLNSVTGAITGAPTQAGDFSFRIRATDDNGAVGVMYDEQDYTITIASAPVVTPPTVDPVVWSEGGLVITGTFDSADTQTLTVTVNRIVYTLGLSSELTASGDTWRLDFSDVTYSLTPGKYDIIVRAVAANGSIVTDSSTADLTISPANQNTRNNSVAEQLASTGNSTEVFVAISVALCATAAILLRKTHTSSVRQ